MMIAVDGGGVGGIGGARFVGAGLLAAIRRKKDRLRSSLGR